MTRLTDSACPHRLPAFFCRLCCPARGNLSRQNAATVATLFRVCYNSGNADEHAGTNSNADEHASADKHASTNGNASADEHASADKHAGANSNADKHTCADWI